LFFRFSISGDKRAKLYVLYKILAQFFLKESFREKIKKEGYKKAIAVMEM